MLERNVALFFETPSGSLFVLNKGDVPEAQHLAAFVYARASGTLARRDARARAYMDVLAAFPDALA